jgi:hypothetical protein
MATITSSTRSKVLTKIPVYLKCQYRISSVRASQQSVITQFSSASILKILYDSAERYFSITN